MADFSRKLSDAPLELQDAVKEFFPPEEWDNAAAISWLESGWNWAAENDTTMPDSPCGTPLPPAGGVDVVAEHSIGYFQINSCNFPRWNPAHFFNVRQNAGTAHALWAVRGWAPWYFSAKALGLI